MVRVWKKSKVVWICMLCLLMSCLFGSCKKKDKENTFDEGGSKREEIVLPEDNLEEEKTETGNDATQVSNTEKSTGGNTNTGGTDKVTKPQSDSNATKEDSKEDSKDESKDNPEEDSKNDQEDNVQDNPSADEDEEDSSRKPIKLPSMNLN